jgi:tetratricopeptide (TPR) repeat protein
MNLGSADPSALYLAGLHHLRAGRVAESIAALRLFLLHSPSHTGAHRNLVRALLAAADFEAVIVETALALHDSPGSAELHLHRGTAFNALSHPEEACDALKTAIALDPKLAPAWLNLGNAFADLDDLGRAEAHCRHAIGLDPSLIEAYASLGFVLTAQGRVDAAIAVLGEGIGRAPDNVHAHWNLATAALLAGDLPRGFAEYEWRKRHDLFRRDFFNLSGPVWDGNDPRGRTILVHAEQGFGDTIQFARYLTAIADRGGIPILACEPMLMPLLATVRGARVVSKFDALPRYDCWIDQMSLPHLFETTLETIPSAAGYASADPVLTAAHRAALARLSSPGPISNPSTRRIGLAWAGNPVHRNDRKRTPPREVFEPLLALPGCRFISLMPDRAMAGVEPPARPLTDYAETAAAIAALDLVIAVDTSVAHVAGALGKPAWVLLPHAPDWRWLLNRSDSPWYRSIRLFRQPSPGDWRSVVASVVVALAA